MATYKGIKGFTIQTIAGDPPAPAQGQVWYNTTSNVLKGYASVTGAWASGGSLNTPRNNSAGAGVSQSSALCFGGTTGPTLQNQTELYDGSSWTEVNNLNTTRYSLGGVGTVTAAIGFAGYASAYPMRDETEVYDGTSWTEVGDVLVARKQLHCAGTSTAALGIGGERAPGPTPTGYDGVESWDGTSWTEGNDILVATQSMASFGTQTAAIMAGGYSGGALNTAITWNGTSWTATNNINEGRSNQNSGCGTSTAGMFCGGAPTGGATEVWSDKTEEYNGTCWTEVADLAQARWDGGMTPSSPSSNSIYWGGSGSGIPYSNVVEEWTSGLSVVTFTSS